MRSVRNRILPVLGIALLSAVAFGGYALWQSWGQLGQTLGSVDLSDRPERTRIPGGLPETSELRQRMEPVAEGTAAADAAGDGSRDVRQEAAALRRELSRVLINDQELFASLDELFEEPDEEILSENLELLREAFLADDP